MDDRGKEEAEQEQGRGGDDGYAPPREPRLLRAQDHLDGHRRSGMEREDAPALKVLAHDHKAGNGAEPEKQKVAKAARAPQRQPGDENEQNVVGKIAQK